MADDRYQKAIREAMASGGHDTILHTLAFYHPSFVDNNGLPTEVRVVNDNQNLYAPIEATAARDAGKWVEWIACAFEVVPPADDDSNNPQITVNIDNVAQVLMPYLKAASRSQTVALVTYRPYIAEHPELGSQLNNPYSLIVRDVSISGQRVSMTASMEDITNKTFLSKIITAEEFPSLGGI